MKTLFSLLLLGTMALGQGGQAMRVCVRPNGWVCSPDECARKWIVLLPPQANIECFGDLNGTVEPCTKLLRRAQQAKEEAGQADVPAISVKDGLSGITMCAQGQKPDAELNMCKAPRWTCADKSRILLTSEDGTRHCVKFDKAAEKAAQK